MSRGIVPKVGITKQPLLESWNKTDLMAEDIFKGYKKNVNVKDFSTAQSTGTGALI